MSKNQRSNLPARNQVSLAQVSASAYAGPIPDASQLEKYENICPGAADRLISMAENQLAHRHSVEKEVVHTNSRNSTLGVVSAFVLGLFTIFGGVYLTLNGHAWPGTILGSTGLIGLSSVFIYGTRASKQERIEKRKND